MNKIHCQRPFRSIKTNKNRIFNFQKIFNFALSVLTDACQYDTWHSALVPIDKAPKGNTLQSLLHTVECDFVSLQPNVPLVNRMTLLFISVSQENQSKMASAAKKPRENCGDEFWTRDKTLILIALYKSYPDIWDVSRQLYFNRWVNYSWSFPHQLSLNWVVHFHRVASTERIVLWKSAK